MSFSNSITEVALPVNLFSGSGFVSSGLFGVYEDSIGLSDVQSMVPGPISDALLEYSDGDMEVYLFHVLKLLDSLGVKVKTSIPLYHSECDGVQVTTLADLESVISRRFPAAALSWSSPWEDRRSTF